MFGHANEREQSGGTKPSAQRHTPSWQTPLAPLQSDGQRADVRTVGRERRMARERPFATNAMLLSTMQKWDVT